jgi:hypothetical protein
LTQDDPFDYKRAQAGIEQFVAGVLKMVNRREEFEEKSLDEIADMTADASSESFLAHAGRTEFLLRQTKITGTCVTGRRGHSKAHETVYILHVVVCYHPDDLSF